MKSCHVFLTAAVCVIGFYLGLAAAEKHMTLHMGLSVDKIHTVDGATVVSSYNRSHSYPVQWIMLVPPDPKQRFLIQFERVNVPCPQELTITEAHISVGLTTVGDRVLDKFCGDHNDLYKWVGHYIRTKKRGYGLHIMWSAVGQTPAKNQGVQLRITAFKQISDCSPANFQCKNMCISQELVCDGVSHCLDGRDESSNCTMPKTVVPMPICLPSPCGGSDLQWQFHHNTLTLMIPMVLALIFLSLAILWRNKRILRRLINDNRPAQRSAISFDSSEIATAEHETFYNAEIPEIVGGEPPNFDPDWGIQLPPPYSPREDLQSLTFPTATQVDLPPPYDSVHHETRGTSASSSCKPPTDSQPHNTSDNGG